MLIVSLTADCVTVSVNFSNFRIQFNVILFFLPFVMAFFNSFIHPLTEALTGDRVNDISNIAPRQFFTFSLDLGQSSHHIAIHHSPIEHVIDGKFLELRNVDVLYLGVFDPSLPIGCKVSQMKYGDAFVVRQVGTTLVGKEPIILFLVLIFSTERFRVHSLIRNRGLRLVVLHSIKLLN